MCCESFEKKKNSDQGNFSDNKLKRNVTKQKTYTRTPVAKTKACYFVSPQCQANINVFQMSGKNNTLNEFYEHNR